MVSDADSPWFASWEVMSARAWWRLNHSGQVSPEVGGGRPLREIPRLRLWDDAMGFGCEREPTTLTVFESLAEDGETGPLVREAVWHRTQDLRRLHEAVETSGQVASFEPTIQVRDGNVPTGRYSELLKEATAFRVPIVWLADLVAVTSDVGAVGFDFVSEDQPPAVLRLQWSYDKPKDWELIAEWFGRLRYFLECCLAADSRSG